jgi:outer membrane protein assembly factor BamB
MVFGNNNTVTEEDKLLDNLAFMCYNEHSSSKYEYLKELLLNDIPDSGIVESEEPVETESTIMPSGSPMDSPWPTFCHDNHHTSLSPYSTADNPYDEKWGYYTPGWVQGGAVIDNDGIIYFGDFDNRINALYPNGTLKWTYRTWEWIQSTPAIAEDGTIYAGSWDYGLYAMNPNGTLKWRVSCGGDISDSPAIGNDGTIYVGNMNNIITAIYPNGTKKWTYKTGDFVSSAPAIGDDDTIYIGSADTYLYAFYPNGTLRWRYKTGGIIKGSPSISDDGTIYIGSYDDYVHAIYPNNGTRIWKCKVGKGTETNPSIGPDGTIYVGGEKLYAINPNGTLKWSFDLGPERWVQMSSPCISSDGTIYIGTNIGSSGVEGGDIIAVNPDGTEHWRKKICNSGWVDSSPCIGPDGTVYIGCAFDAANGYLFAFGRGELKADADGPHYGLIDEPVEFSGSATGGYPPYSYHWDFGDTHTSDEQNPQHTYTTQGNYTVTLTVTDDAGNTSDDYTWAWIQDGNSPPDIPDIDGPNKGTAGKTYPYAFTTSDSEGLQVWYYIDWDDGSNTGWKGPYSSGLPKTFNHKWTNEGTYTIKCKAKDPYDDESSYGELTVRMPRDKAVSSSLLLRFLERYPLLNRLLNLVNNNCF